MVSILKFSHCESTNIFCFKIPSECPICGDNVSNLSSPPVAIPTPFVNGLHTPCSVLVKPTFGCFLSDYTSGSNLHTGVTDSKGSIYNYDENGLKIDTDVNSWKQSLAIPIIDFVDEDLTQVWDERLHPMINQSSWQATRYHPDSHNCFDFVIEFLNCMNFNAWKGKCSEPVTRAQFSRNYILPATTRAAWYIRLYRSVQLHGSVTKAD